MKIVATILLNLLFFCCAMPIQANEVIFSDDFQSDLSKWTVSAGSPADWKLDAGTLVGTINKRNSITEILPANEFWTGSKYYSTEFDYKPFLGADKNFVFNYRDPNNWYEFHFSGNNLYLAENNSGVYTNLTNKIVPIQNGTAYKIKITVLKGDITLSINDEIVLNHHDKTSMDKTGKIAFKVGTGAVYPSSASFDNLVVTSLDDTLGVNLIRQDQEPWGPMEYDSATKWATASEGSTFKAWGCALSSAVMIMNFHGITQMPDGSLITPLSLNNWMLENHGYYDGGNVQFPVLAALTKQLSDQYGHVALEYHREDDAADVRNLATSEITAGRPVIVKKPGHFVVADGIVPSAEDFFIKDPINSVTKFSQLNAPLISTRTFMPSHTDVSYLSITTAPESQVQIYDSTGHLLEYTPVIEQMENQSNPGEFSPAVQLIEIPKPAAGVYKVVLLNAEASATASESATSILTITPAGGITQHVVPAGEKEALLSISADAPSQIEYTRPEGFSKLRQTILTLWQTQGIKNESLYRVLDSLAAIGEETDNKNEQLIIVRILRRAVNTHYVKQHLTSEAKATLLQEIKELQTEVKPTPTPKATATPKPSHTPKPSPSNKPDKNEHRR